MNYPLTDEQLTDLQQDCESSFTVTLDLSDDAIAETILDRIIDENVDRNSVSIASLTVTVELSYSLEEDFAQEDEIAAAMCDCCYKVE